MKKVDLGLKPLIVKNVFDDKGNFIEQRILMPDDKDYEREYQVMLEQRSAKLKQNQQKGANNG